MQQKLEKQEKQKNKQTKKIEAVRFVGAGLISKLPQNLEQPFESH